MPHHCSAALPITLRPKSLQGKSHENHTTKLHLTNVTLREKWRRRSGSSSIGSGSAARCPEVAAMLPLDAGMAPAMEARVMDSILVDSTPPGRERRRQRSQVVGGCRATRRAAPCALAVSDTGTHNSEAVGGQQGLACWRVAEGHRSAPRWAGCKPPGAFRWLRRRCR